MLRSALIATVGVLAVTGLAPELVVAQVPPSPFVEAFAPLSVSCGSAPSDAYSDAVLADSPLVYYPLNDSTGTTMCDVSGNSNDGSYASEGLEHAGHGAPVTLTRLLALKPRPSKHAHGH